MFQIAKRNYNLRFYQEISKDQKPWTGGVSLKDAKTSQWNDQEFKEDCSPEVTTLGAGCYWGTEKFFAQDFELIFPGSVLATKVGFMSLKPEAPHFSEPNYRDVCSGQTPYVEVLHLLFNSKAAPYE